MYRKNFPGRKQKRRKLVLARLEGLTNKSDACKQEIETLKQRLKEGA